MPIRVACTSCGKKLQVRDELAGKKVKCPGCGIAFAAVADVAAAASTGIKASAPKVAPPGTKDKVSAKPMAKKAPPPPPMDDEDDDEEMEERPARSKGKKGKQAAGGSLLWLWLSLAGVLVIGGGVAAYFIFFSGPPSNTGPIVGNKDKGPITPPIITPPVVTPPVTGNQSLADLVPGDSWIFLSASGESTSNPALGGDLLKNAEMAFQQVVGFPQSDLERVTVFSVASFPEMKQSPDAPFVFVVQTKKPVNQQQVSATLQQGEAFKKFNPTVQFLNDKTFLAGTARAMQAYQTKSNKGKAAGTLERALSQSKTSKGMVAAVIVPPELAQEVGPQLKDAPPFVLSLLKTKAVLVSMDQDTNLRLNATVILGDAGAAQEVKTAVDGLVGLAGFFLGTAAKDPNLGEMAALAQQALKDIKVTVADKELTIAAQTDVKAFVAASMKAAAAAQGAAGNAQESNNLKMIGLAWHVYHDVYKGLPAQTGGKGLSWRVAILPFIEQDQLYKQFNLNEPWDSPTNKKLIPLMPKTYESVGKKAPPGFTYYQTFVGPNTINKNPMKGMMLQQFADGTSNTLIVAEAAQPVEWTKPADIQVTPSQPVTLGGSVPGAPFVVFADGRVQRISQKLDQKVLRNLIDPADGNVIPPLDGGAGLGQGLSAPPKTGIVPPTAQVESKVSAFPKKAELPVAQPKEAGKPSPRVVSIARGKRGDLGNGQKLLANLANHNIVAIKLEGIPANVQGFDIIRGATFKAGGDSVSFNAVSGSPPGPVWVGAVVPANAKSITITLPGNIAPFTVDLPSAVADEVKVFD